MERNKLRLPGISEPVEPHAARFLPQLPNELDFEKKQANEGMIEMWTTTYMEESQWMIRRFPQHHSELSRIVLRPRASDELFVPGDVEQVSERFEEYSNYTAQDVEEFINMATGVGSDVVAYENIKRFVLSLKTNRAATQRLIDSLCVMSASSFAGQSGDYTIAAIVDGTPAKIARNLPQLFDGYLDALAEFEESVKLDAAPERSKFVQNTSPLMQEPTTRELVKHAFFNASVHYATMAPHIKHRAQYERELVQYVELAQQEGRVPDGNQPIQHIRAYVRASAKFALFYDLVSQALLDPTHAQHADVISSVREYKDFDMVDLVLMQMCCADGKDNVRTMKKTYERISSLAVQEDAVGFDVFGHLRDSLESYMHTYDIVFDELEPTSGQEGEEYDDEEASVNNTQGKPKMPLFEVAKSSPKVRPPSEIGDMKRKMAKERRKKPQATHSPTTSEAVNEISVSQAQKRLIIEDHEHIGESIEHLPEGDQALVVRAIGYYQEYGLGMRKIRRTENKYRLRAGGYRLIFEREESGCLRFVEVVRKTSGTYKQL